MRLKGAKAVALMAQDSSLSAVDAILETQPDLRRKLSPADGSNLRGDEANSVLDTAHLVHTLVKRMSNIVHLGRSSQRKPSACSYHDMYICKLFPARRMGFPSMCTVITCLLVQAALVQQLRTSAALACSSIYLPLQGAVRLAGLVCLPCRSKMTA